MLPTFSQHLTLQEAFETAAQMNEELKRIELVHFAKDLKFQSIHFLHFFAKRRKSVEKIIHQKKNSGH